MVVEERGNHFFNTYECIVKHVVLAPSTLRGGEDIVHFFLCKLSNHLSDCGIIDFYLSTLLFHMRATLNGQILVTLFSCFDCVNANLEAIVYCCEGN